MNKQAILVNGKPINYAADGLIPEHMRAGMERYMEQGVNPGSFLTAVLSNDLVVAALCADSINRPRLHDYCMWLYNYAPSGSFGSPEAVNNWIKSYES